MSKNEISYKANLPPHRAVVHLEQLIDSLKKGSVCVQVGQAHVLLDLKEVLAMNVEVSASARKGKHRLSWELTWKKAESNDGQEPSMFISSSPPTAPAPSPSPAPAKPTASKTRAAAKPKKKKVVAKPAKNRAKTAAKKPATTKRKSPAKTKAKPAAKAAKAK